MSSSAATNKRVFREYIGAQAKGVRLDNVPINPGVEFHFILAFALDYTHNPTDPRATNGNFTPFWDTGNLTPQAVEAVKKKNTNVRVMLSVGGYSVGGYIVGGQDKLATFDPSDESSWVDNAFQTLSDIMAQYHLDGVDIDYESFAKDTVVFTRCVGELLRRLKASKPGIITSIAPYSDTQRYYQALWNGYKQHIDYVNFQFYAYGRNTTEEQYIGYYDQQTANYNGGKVLAAINTSRPQDVNIVPSQVALNACTTLNNRHKLKGIFIWSADSSVYTNANFYYETAAQHMLAN